MPIFTMSGVLWRLLRQIIHAAIFQVDCLLHLSLAQPRLASSEKDDCIILRDFHSGVHIPLLLLAH